MNSDNKEEILLEPFSTELICNVCSELCSGKFCTKCGSNLEFDFSKFAEKLYNRLNIINYITYNKWKTESQNLYSQFHFKLWESNPEDILIKLIENDTNITIEFVIIDDKNLEQEIILKIKNQVDKIFSDINFQNKIDPKERTIDRNFILTFRYIQIDKLNKIQKFKGSAKKTAKTKFKLFNSKGKPHICHYYIKWNKISLNFEDLSIRSETKFPYDIVRFQANVLLNQFKNKLPKEKNFIQYIFLGVFESIIEYFDYFFKFFLYPSIYSKLIANGSIKPTKIVALYMVGLLCSVLIPYIFSVGYLNSEKLIFFNDFPLLFSDLAELLFELFTILIITIFIHISALTNKKRGSFSTMFFGLIFFKAFIQVFERSYIYLTDIPFLNLNYKYALHKGMDYYKALFQFLRIPFLVYSYYIYKLAFAIYKTNEIVIGWFLAYLSLIFLSIYMSNNL